MGELLFDLENLLLSRKDMTPQEAHVLEACKSKAVRNFTGSAILGAGVAWAVTGRLSIFHRIYTAGGVGSLFGLWRFARSIDSCVENILAQDGTRLQFELANIIVTKYHNDPQRMQLIAKHFYTEKLFSDSTADRPMLKWRYRNFYGDPVHGQVLYEHEHDHQSEFLGEPPNKSKNDALSQSHNVGHYDSNIRITNFGAKQVPVPVSSEFDLMADPLDCVFGYNVPIEEINSSNSSKTQPQMHTRAHRKSHRRSRVHHHERHLTSF